MAIRYRKNQTVSAYADTVTVTSGQRFILSAALRYGVINGTIYGMYSRYRELGYTDRLLLDTAYYGIKRNLRAKLRGMQK